MKSIITILAAWFVAITVGAVPIEAQAIQNPSTFNSIEEVINAFLGLVRPIVVLTLVAILMYGGWVYLTAQDDDSKVSSAKKIMGAAIVGFIIIVLAPVIVQLVGAFLGVEAGLFDFSVGS